MKAAAETGSERAPAYQPLYDLLRERITAGAYPVGDLLPTEESLCRDLDASRYAVREALARLETEGLIQRRRGSGSRVLRRLPLPTYRSGLSSREDLLNYASATHMVWQDRDLLRADGKLARRLGCDENREWQRMRGIRHDEDGDPLALVEAFVDVSLATIPDDADFGRAPVYQWLAKHRALRCRAVSQDIRATRLSPRQAEQLHESVESPVLEVIRRYFDDSDRIYLISRNLYRGRDFVLSHRFQLDDGE